MRLTTSDIPESMYQVDSQVRGRALGIANRLVREGQEKAEAIREAVERAQKLDAVREVIAEVPPEAQYHVVETRGGWGIQSESDDGPRHVFEDPKKAVDHGVILARDNSGILYVHDGKGDFEEIYNYAAPEQTVMGRTAEVERVTTESLQELYVDELLELHSVETQLIDALQRMANVANNDELRLAIESHLEETREQKAKLEQILNRLDETPGRKRCEALEAIIEEVEEFVNGCSEPPTCDAGIIAGMQRAEHYEIARYGTARAYANQLDHNEDLGNLNDILEQEKAADAELTRIAEEVVNPKASKRT